MNETLAAQTAPKTAAECKAAIDALLLEMRRLNEKMVEDQAEIDRLKAETRTIGAHTDLTLSQLEAHMTALRAGV